VSEKSKGILIFATNTSDVDYVKIAEINAELIKQHMGLPTTIVQGTRGQNKRLVSGAVTEWHNGGRCDAYELSPYDETLVLDGDYLVFDDSLLKVLDTVEDYAIPHKHVYINDQVNDTMGKYSCGPMLWATVIAFKRTEKARLLFELARMIQNNYAYYRALYKLHPGPFRNDATFTIADRIVNGYSENMSCRVPWPIMTISGEIDRMVVDNERIIVYKKERAYVLPRANLHLHDKRYLQNGFEYA
jgi:hypothetical protein